MSKLSDSLTKLGFETKEKQESFVNNLYLAGYLSPESIWQALNLMQYEWKQGVERSFDNVSLSLKTSGAYQQDLRKFNAESFIESFMQKDIFFDEQNISDMMLFLAQNAFGRNVGQERNELGKQQWSDVYKDEYLKNAKTLELVEEKLPSQKKYDETWIQGAARLRCKTRMQSAKKHQEQGVDLGVVRLLTGDRELWVEIDKLPQESPEQCKEFMRKLAAENSIKIDGFEEKVVANNKRTYPKYAEGETKKLTETLMAKAVYKEVFGVDLQEDRVVDSKAQEGRLRPDTAITAVDAVRQGLIARIKKSDFGDDKAEILVVSNQPYVDRQVLTNIRAVQGELKKQGIGSNLNFSGAGDVCEVGVTAVHSEMAALVNERYCDALERGLMKNENVARLTFQGRSKQQVPEMPKVDFDKIVIPQNASQLDQSSAKILTI